MQTGESCTIDVAYSHWQSAVRVDVRLNEEPAVAARPVARLNCLPVVASADHRAYRAVEVDHDAAAAAPCIVAIWRIIDSTYFPPRAAN